MTISEIKKDAIAKSNADTLILLEILDQVKKINKLLQGQRSEKHGNNSKK